MREQYVNFAVANHNFFNEGFDDFFACPALAIWASVREASRLRASRRRQTTCSLSENPRRPPTWQFGGNWFNRSSAVCRNRQNPVR
jgi:hypothetical protein